MKPLLLAIAACCAFPGGSAAAVELRQWHAPQAIGGEGMVNPQLAMDRNGNASVLFASSAEPADAVHIARRPAGGDFGAPEPLAWMRTRGVGLGGVAIAYDSRGRLGAAWSDEREGDLRYATFERSGERLSEGTLAPAEDQAIQVQLQPDRLQNLYAAWWTHSPTEGCCVDVTVAELQQGERTGRPTVISRDRGGPALGFAVAGSGTAVAAWPTYGDGFHASIRPPFGEFGRSERIDGASVGMFGATPKLAIDAAGEVLLAVQSAEPRPWDAPPRTRVDFVSRPPGGSFGDAQTVALAEGDTSEPTIAAGPAGEAAIAWSETLAGGIRALRVSIRRADGSFSQPQTLVTGRLAPAPPALGMDAAGNAILTWAVPDEDATWTIQAAHRPPHGSFGEPRTISEPAIARGLERYPDPRIAVGGPGNAIVTWHRFPTEDFRDVRVEAAVFDVAAPRLPDFEITPPPVGTGPATPEITFRWRVSEESNVRIALRRRGRAVAKWAKAAKPGANTLRVSAAGVRPGRYMATLRATDSLGNRSKLKRARLRLRAKR